eukprot:15341635-Ditylum_brightwellii.AAC.1
MQCVQSALNMEQDEQLVDHNKIQCQSELTFNAMFDGMLCCAWSEEQHIYLGKKSYGQHKALGYNGLSKL